MAGTELHFLTRLDKPTRDQLRLAHALYRDYDALRFVLENGARGDGERVALSLADPDEGPFAVVTRRGRFVTCLSAGDAPGDLEVVSRERVDALLEVHAEARARDADGEAAAPPAESLDRMFGRLFDVGPYLTREEFFALSALTPLLEPQLLYLLTSQYPEIAGARHQLARLLARVDGIKPREFERFEAFWNELWSVAHAAVLLASHGGDFFARKVEAAPALHLALTFPLTTSSTMGLALRGAWAAAKVGPWFLPVLARAFVEARDVFRVNDAAFGLAAMALRHPRLRPDVSRALAARPATADASIDVYARWLAECAERAFDAKDPPAYGRAFGATLWRELTEHLAEGSPLRFATEADVPDDIALPCALLSRVDILVEQKHAGHVMLALPFVAPAEAEDLFFAEEHIVAVRRPARVDDAIEILGGFREVFLGAAEPKREGPSRQGPCPCGSGKKYKRCCG